MNDASTILCFGEILWDRFPDRRLPGGATLNAAYHLRKIQCQPVLISTVGCDEPGEALIEVVDAFGVNRDFVRTDEELPTGINEVILDENGNATYRIPEPAAWDRIFVDDRVLNAAQQAEALIYSSLAQRQEHNRDQIGRLLKLSELLKVYDANLRSPYDDPNVVLPLAAEADVVKLNRDELYRLTDCSSESVDLPAAAQRLADRIGVQRICITLGADGAAFLDQGEWIRAEAPPVETVDTVGAGDAFLAVLTAGMVRFPKQVRMILDAACRIAGAVASREGATPAYDAAEYAPEFFK